VSGVYVYDASALIALFDAYKPVFDLLDEAAAERIQIVWPACAVAEANTYLRASHNTWTALLLAQVTTVELAESGAVDVGMLAAAGGLATGQVIHEARATQGLVVTREAYRYQWWNLPLLIL
jgi:hypothetical protein